MPIYNPTSVSSDWSKVLKTADQTINNSAALTNDTELLFTVEANEVYYFDLLLMAQSPTRTTLVVVFTVPAGAALTRLMFGSGTTVFFSGSDGLANRNYTSMTTVPTYHVSNYLYVGAAAAGIVQFKWAQDAATAEDTKVLKNSFLNICRLS
jgi:hypothetical protein